MMMNDIAIANINRIVTSEISQGHAILGIISVDDKGHMILCWRTDDYDRARQWEEELKTGTHGKINRQMVDLPKEA